jgi:predicted ATPase
VLRLFQAGSRLVTLTGPGGTGKTRLAVEIAAEAVDRYPAGVFFVDLAPLRDAHHVVVTIASVLGVRENPEEPARETLRRFLAERHLLLVLDNCEQVLDAAPDIAGLLARCAHLAVLATSREPLRVRVEQTFPVPPLPLPETQHQPDPAALRQVPSVALFVERAQAADPTFTLTEANAASVAAICHRLDGLPLAIELAAARVRLLPPKELLPRLERSLSLLASGARDAPQRQRTLRDTIAWSYDLLPPEDQALFRQLGAFVGGWTLEAAESVVSPSGAVDVLAGLGRLVERSLVLRGDRPEAELRFSLLETIREYAREQLAASGEETQTREQHAAWVLSLAERGEPELFRSEQQTWRERLEAERPNIRAALGWFEQTADAEQAQRLAGKLTTLSWLGGHLREGQEWLERALAIPGEVSPATRAWAILGIATLIWFRGDNDAARPLLEQGLEIAREGGFALGVAHAQHQLAVVDWMQGDLEQALGLGELGLVGLREAGHPEWLAIALGDVAIVALLNGDARGNLWSDEGLALNRTLGNRWFIANHLSDLGVVAQRRGDLIEAARHYAESTRLFAEVGDTWYIANPLGGLATIALAQGQVEAAVRLIGVATALREASGARAFPWEQRRDDQASATARAALGEERYAQTLQVGRTMRLEQAVDEAIAVAAGAARVQTPAQA